MPESFRTLRHTPPLRLTVRAIAKLGDDLVAQAGVGGKVDIQYQTEYTHGIRVEHASTADFLNGALEADEDPQAVHIRVHGWTPVPEEGWSPGEIARTYSIEFRRFGSQFQIGSSDANWGRGAVQTLNTWMTRHRPRYVRLLRFVPFTTGILLTLPFLFVLAAAEHERAATPLFFLVLCLSIVGFAMTAWFAHQHANSRVLPHTQITREQHERDVWAALRLAAGMVAFLADLATVVVVLTR